MSAAVRGCITRDVAYSPQPGARLDVYAPAGADGEAPVVVFAHCGWLSGGQRRRLFRYIGAGLASRGFVAVIPDGGLDADAGHERALGNLAAAAAWARVNAAGYGGDPSRVFLMGHASGAYLVAMLCLEARWLGAHGVQLGDLRGAVGISGLYEVLSLNEGRATAVFGPRARWAAAEPVFHAHPLAPPMLLVAGQRDEVDPETTSRLACALRTVGGQVAEIRYPKLCDRGGLRRLTGPTRFHAIVLREVERFVRLHSLGPGA
ncbi:MAG: esterase/lipase/thioesterase family protein [Caulobacteraceae bacterium]|nr:esterase/lipase/thioesterase family protein [Caulobacteraceae bacterium]